MWSVLAVAVRQRWRLPRSSRPRVQPGPTSQWSLASILTLLGQLMRGWANYFKHAIAKWTFSKLDTFTFAAMTARPPRPEASRRRAGTRREKSHHT
jgi:Group II intron, maturase-specific domain